jgi:phosphoserine phosphatase RsbU/P
MIESYSYKKSRNSQRTILIVDDQPINIQAICGLFTNDYNVKIATCGIKALEIVGGVKPPDIILLDIQMPEMDGIEVLKRIRRMPIEKPPYILILTVMGEESEIIEGLNAGANDYLTRPFKPGELTARVEVGRRMVEMQDTLLSKLHELRKALLEISTLRGMLPICAQCKRIRDDKGYWNQIETYISSHTGAEFSHSLCPDCIKTLYPDLDMEDEDDF